MKVLHLATGKSGGARLAAVRLSKLQMEFGMKTRLIPHGDDHLTTLRKVTFPQLAGKMATLTQLSLTIPPYGLFSTLSISNYKEFGIDFTDFDIVHVHNWYNLLDINDFEFIASKSNLVFTLHDERLITGGCHYTFDCMGYLGGCAKCPGIRIGEIVVKKKKAQIDKVFSRLGDYGLISPSEWLLEKSKESQLFKNAKVAAVIPNVTNFQAKLKKSPKIGSGEFPNSIIFVAADINQRIKGLQLLIQSLNKVCRIIPNVHLHIVGKGYTSIEMNFGHTFHGYLLEAEIEDLMKKTAICVIPSILDNLPSVAIEAIRSSNLLIVNDTGGLSEVVIDGVTGFKSQINSDDLAEKIIYALKLPQKRVEEIKTNALKKISQIYDDKIVLGRHLQLYESIALK